MFYLDIGSVFLIHNSILALPLLNLLSGILPFKFHSVISLKAFLMALIFPLRFSLCKTCCNFTCSISSIFLSLFLQILLSSLPPPQLPLKVCRWQKRRLRQCRMPEDLLKICMMSVMKSK